MANWSGEGCGVIIGDAIEHTFLMYEAGRYVKISMENVLGGMVLMRMHQWTLLRKQLNMQSNTLQKELSLFCPLLNICTLSL